MKIYTKTGDKGSTSLYDLVRVSKDDIRVESYGTVDELGSALAVARNFIENEELIEEIYTIQNKLFVVAENLATSTPEKVKHFIVEEDIVARTVCRRAERRIISLSGEVYVDPLVIKFVNRLADTIYAFARACEDEMLLVDFEKPLGEKLK